MIDGETVHSTFLKQQQQQQISFCIFLRVHEYLILLTYTYYIWRFVIFL